MECVNARFDATRTPADFQHRAGYITFARPVRAFGVSLNGARNGWSSLDIQTIDWTRNGAGFFFAPGIAVCGNWI
jgi:hypothetical protein